MRYGLSLFTSDRGIRPADAAKAAEANGFDAFYVPEHTHIPPVSRDSDHPPGTQSAELPDDRYMRTLDPWVALGTAASVTNTIRLGTSVALPLEHDPITLAKTIASLDHLSGGRVVFGVGFGWNAEELADHGVPPNKRRTALREYLEAMGELWSKEEASYDGQFVKYGPAGVAQTSSEAPPSSHPLGRRRQREDFQVDSKVCRRVDHYTHRAGDRRKRGTAPKDLGRSR